MKAGHPLIDDLAGAILDGTPIDWASAEASAQQPDQFLIKELKGPGGSLRGSSRDSTDSTHTLRGVFVIVRAQEW